MKSLLLCLFFLSGYSFSTSALSRAILQPEEKKEVEGILLKNDLLFNAFLKNDGSAILKAAEDLSSALSSTKISKLNKLKLQIKELRALKAAGKREDNLGHYEVFLAPLIQVVKDYELSSKYNIFYCPMVKKYWVQSSETNKPVRNVFAMEMLECGSQESHFK